jgi:hypothetical protein
MSVQEAPLPRHSTSLPPKTGADPHPGVFELPPPQTHTHTHTHTHSHHPRHTHTHTHTHTNTMRQTDQQMDGQTSAWPPSFPTGILGADSLEADSHSLHLCAFVCAPHSPHSPHTVAVLPPLPPTQTHHLAQRQPAALAPGPGRPGQPGTLGNRPLFPGGGLPYLAPPFPGMELLRLSLRNPHSAEEKSPASRPACDPRHSFHLKIHLCLAFTPIASPV